MFLRQLRPRLFTFVTNVILPRLIFFLNFLAFANVLVTLQQSLPSTNPGYDIVSWKILECRETIRDTDNEELNRNDIPWWHLARQHTIYFLWYLHFTFSQDKLWTFWGLELKVGRLINLVLSVVCFSTYHVLFFKKL